MEGLDSFIQSHNREGIIMVYIESYLLRPGCKVTNLEEVNEMARDLFVSVENTEQMGITAKEFNDDYIEGAIILKYDDAIILDFKLWDLVDQLWAYFVNAIEELVNGNQVEFFFPDQPVKILLKSISEEIVLFQVSAGNISSYTLPKVDLYTELLKSAEKFFDSMVYIFPDKKKFKNELEKARRIKLILSTK